MYFFFFSHILFLCKNKEETTMEKYVCLLCGYVYDPKIGDFDNDIASNTPFLELPEDWKCPICSADKSQFIKQN